MATTDANGFITIENSDLFNISHANGNAAAASAVATRVTTAEGNISDIQTALGNKVDTSTYTAGMATKVNSSTYTSGMAGKVDKVDGKGLSTEDYTTAEKTKLAGIADGANNYSLPTASTNTLGGVKVGAGLSIASGILSGKIRYVTNPFSKVWKNYMDEVTATADAWFFGEGTSDSPALCYLRASVSYNPGLTDSDYLLFILNGFKVEDAIGSGIRKTVTGSVFMNDNVASAVGGFYFSSIANITAKFSRTTYSANFNAIFPAVFTS